MPIKLNFDPLFVLLSSKKKKTIFFLKLNLKKKKKKKTLTQQAHPREKKLNINPKQNQTKRILKKVLVKFLLTKYGPTQTNSQKKKKKTQIINPHPPIDQNH